MIGIIDYGAGNLASVQNAFERIGNESIIFSNPEHIKDFSHIVLPGVGSFSKAMESIISLGWKKQITLEVSKGKPILGICLGMQLLFDEGFEGGKNAGLGILNGSVQKLDSRFSLKIPHIGWNRLFIKTDHPVMRGIKEHIDFYFVHSYKCVPTSEDIILSETKYGEDFVSSVFHKNIIGMQFHPEKSQPAGLKILQNFANWDGKC